MGGGCLLFLAVTSIVLTQWNLCSCYKVRPRDPGSYCCLLCDTTVLVVATTPGRETRCLTTTFDSHQTRAGDAEKEAVAVLVTIVVHSKSVHTPNTAWFIRGKTLMRSRVVH